MVKRLEDHSFIIRVVDSPRHAEWIVGWERDVYSSISRKRDSSKSHHFLKRQREGSWARLIMHEKVRVWDGMRRFRCSYIHYSRASGTWAALCVPSRLVCSESGSDDEGTHLVEHPPKSQCRFPKQRVLRACVLDI